MGSAGRSGIVNENVLPSPTVLSTSMLGAARRLRPMTLKNRVATCNRRDAVTLAMK